MAITVELKSKAAAKQELLRQVTEYGQNNMQTVYGADSATTVFATVPECAKFVKENSDALVMVDVDLFGKMVRWRFK